jgi:hypothetical protein
MPEFVGPLAANMKRAWAIVLLTAGCAVLAASGLSYLYHWH